MSESSILEYVSDAAYRPLKIKELARKLHVSSSDYAGFRRTVKNMLASGKLDRLRRGRIGLPEKEILVTGTLSVTKTGRGFVTPESGAPEIVIESYGLAAALHGDQVEVRIIGRDRHGRPLGEIIRIVDRKLVNVVGTYRQTRFQTFVRPDDPRLKIQIRVAPPKGQAIKDGAKVVVHLGDWRDPTALPEGKIVQVLGMPDEPGVDVLTIVHQFNLPTSFPRAVEGEAQMIPSGISEGEIARRLDLRKTVTFTVDPEDAKDHDDAVSLEATATGYRLGVHIADVSYYVRPHGSLDKEARLRTASAYLVDRVLPMLPEKLSNDLCSLKEGKDRLTMSVIVDLDKAANVVHHEIADSIICSQGKLTYDQVQEHLDAGTGFEKQKRVGARLKLMAELAVRLIEKRLQSGSIDFDVAEYKAILGADGRAEQILKRERKLSHRIIEEFMLLANKIVASELLARNVPVLYRVHPAPDPKKLDSFIGFAQNFGHRVSFGSPPRAKFISDFILSLKGKDEEELLNELLIRSMQKAYYQPENIGHFGLAFASYLHFTAPIRRYPDLIVHRILKQVIRGEYHPAKGAALKASLSRIGKHCSEQELVIMEAERESLAAKQAEYLSRQLGEVYSGVISGMLKFGFFVRILDVGAEGMVRLSSLSDDYYVADVDNSVITGTHTRRQFHLGDRVKVQVVNVNLQSGEIDLWLVEDTRPRQRQGTRKKTLGRR